VNRFPAFCGLLVGGSTLLQIPLRVILRQLGTIAKRQDGDFLLTIGAGWLAFAALLTAWFSLQLLNSNQARKTEEEDVNPRNEAIAKDIKALEETPDVEPGQRPPREPVALAGKTLDLTLFAVIRALDVVVGELWSVTDPADMLPAGGLTSCLAYLT
jgi:hypothetical protein